MKKKYSKALAVMCAVTMATSTAQLPSAYADVETPIVDNNEEGGNEATEETVYENGEHEFSFDKLEVAESWGPEIETGTDGKATIKFPGQYSQIFFALPEGIDPLRVTKIEVKGANKIAVKASGADKSEVAVSKDWNNILELRAGTNFAFIDLMCMDTAEETIVNADSIIITLSDPGSPFDEDSQVVTKKLSDLTVAKNGGAEIDEDGNVTFYGTWQSVFFEFPDDIPEGMVVNNIEVKGNANTFNYKVMNEDQITNDPWGNGIVANYGNPVVSFDSSDAKYFIIMSGDTPDDPDVNPLTYGSFSLDSEIEFTLVPSQGVQEDLVDLRDVIASDEGLGKDAYVGCAVTGTETDDEKVMQLATKHFNAVTLGNELKLDCMLGYNNASSKNVEFEYVDSETFEPIAEEDVEGNAKAMKVPVLDYKKAEDKLDLFLEWNEKNPDKQIKVRGHVLVWHSQAPGWFFKKDYAGLFQDNTGAPELKATDGVADEENGTYAEDATKEEMDKRQEWYIKTMLEHFTAPDSKYKDLFYGWDVVNEAVSDNTGTYRNAEENSRWWGIYGDNSFITNAFVYANKYAPKSLKLYYNDYNETVGSKIGGIVQLLKDVKATKGARIDGFGMQGHYGINSPTMAQVEEAVRAYSDVVDEVMLTELDVKSSSDYDGTAATRKAEYTKQAWYYKSLYDTLVRLNKEDGITVSGIVVWGTVDKYSWLNDSNNVGGASNGGAQCPLLFDGNYQAKPAYWAFADPSQLEPYINNVLFVESTNGSFDNANVYEFGGEKASVKFAPIWNIEKVSYKVDITGKLADADTLTLYYVEGENIKTKVVKVSDMEKTENGYTTVIEVEGKYGVGEGKFDFVLEAGEEKIAFNDLKLTQATSDEYFAKSKFKPFAEITKGTVKIDGEEDDAWKSATTVPLTINLGANAKSEAKLLWDEDNLYVKVEVTDSVLNKDNTNAWEQDSLEVFVDENNHKSSSYEEDDKQYRINYENEYSHSGTHAEGAVQSVATVPKEGGGYNIEAAFKWTDVKPAVGDMIGLELQINDADESGKRVGILSWYDETGMGWSSPAVFGTAKLVDEVKESGEDVKTDDTKKDENLVDGPKEGTKVSDKKYKYVVTKAGSTDGKNVGTLEVIGLKKKSLKTLKIAETVKIGGVKYYVTSVGKAAFKGNKKATKVYIGKKVKAIKANAFAKMKKLKTVVINSKILRSIGKSAFAKDKKLRKIIVKSTKLKSVGKKAFKGVSKKCKIKVPKNKKKAYKKTLKSGGFKGKIK